MKALKTKLKLNREIIETESGVPESARDIGIIDDNSNINLDGTASGSYGIALGTGAQTQNTSSIAIGSGGNTIATADESIQLGYGVNNKAKSFQVYEYELLDGNTGKIPSDRLQDVPSLTEENNFAGRNVFNAETQFNSPVESNSDISIINHTLKILERTSSGDALTWVINEKPDYQGEGILRVDIPLTAGGNSYNGIQIEPTMKYPSPACIISAIDGPEIYDGAQFTSEFTDRTIIFETAPTGELLTWLQANAVPQTGQGNDIVTWYSADEIVIEENNDRNQFVLTLPRKTGTIALTTDIPDVSVDVDNTTITKTADNKLQAVGLQDETDNKTLTAHDIWLACSIEREV